MGNRKISITAEFVSIIRSETDPSHLYFVSKKAQKLYDICSKIISQKKLREIFARRLKLSEKFDQKISAEKPEQVIELAAGYSLRGFNLCLKDKNVIYIDSDFAEVIFQKRKILETICQKEGISFPDNYFLVALDVLENNLFEKIRGFVAEEKKTLIMAEGLTSYFSDLEFQRFLENIKMLLANFSACEFYSHESILQPKGIIYNIVRKVFIRVITRTKGRHIFKTVNEFASYLKSKNINKFKICSDQSGFLLYSIFT